MFHTSTNRSLLDQSTRFWRTLVMTSICLLSGLALTATVVQAQEGKAGQATEAANAEVEASNDDAESVLNIRGPGSKSRLMQPVDEVLSADPRPAQLSAVLMITALVDGPDSMNCYPDIAIGWYCYVDGELVTFEYRVLCSHNGHQFDPIDLSVVTMERPMSVTVPVGVTCTVVAAPTGNWQSNHSSLTCPALGDGEVCSVEFVNTWGEPAADTAVVTVTTQVEGPDSMNCYPGTVGGFFCLIGNEVVLFEFTVDCSVDGDSFDQVYLQVGEMELPSPVEVPSGVDCTVSAFSSDDWQSNHSTLTCAASSLETGEVCSLEFVYTWVDSVAGSAIVSIYASVADSDAADCFPGAAGGWICFVDDELVVFEFTVFCSVDGDALEPVEVQVSTTWQPVPVEVPAGAQCYVVANTPDSWHANHPAIGCPAATLEAGETCSMMFIHTWQDQ